MCLRCIHKLDMYKKQRRNGEIMTVKISRELKRYNHLISEIEGVYHKVALKLGLSDSAINVLYTICNYGTSCMLQDICRDSGISKQTINSAVRKLEAEGILYMEAVDKKTKRVFLTDAGKELAEKTALKVIQAENDIFASWPEEDVEKYLELTERYLMAFRERSRYMERM